MKRQEIILSYFTDDDDNWNWNYKNEGELVRCKECKYAKVVDVEDDQDGYTCQFHNNSIWFSGSYCSWGERRSDVYKA